MVLTADRTIMNNFHLKRNFAISHYGSADSFPPWLFRLMAGEPKKKGNGEVIFPPYPLRKVESRLIEQGYKAITVSPNDLSDYLDESKALGIHTIDPLGYGTTPLLRDVMGLKEPYSVRYFRKIIDSDIVAKRKNEGLKIIIGGAGSWQFKKHPEIQDRLGIDCVVLGESERIIGDLMRKVGKGEKIPKVVVCNKESIPRTDEIVPIRKPSNFGSIEIGRGCVRGCKFCDVSKNEVRWLPLTHIEKELKINSVWGIKQGLLHSEDCLLYGQDSVIPDTEKVVKLFELVFQYHSRLILTHFSIAAVSAVPGIIPRCMEVVLDKQDFLIGETGIETASERLLRKTMSGKMKPFKKGKWIETIHNTMGILNDNRFIPYCSFIMGLPGEKEDDINETIELIEDMKHYRSFLIPCRFTPLGKFENERRFPGKINDIDSLHKEMVRKCLVHNLKWVDDYRKELYSDSKIRPLLDLFAKTWIGQYKRKARKNGLI